MEQHVTAAPVPGAGIVGKPRRPHHKSRTGCLQCKQRKVKCDEQKPICKKCEGHNAQCSYLLTHPLKRGPPTVQSMLASPSPTTSPSSAVQPPPTPSPLTLQPAIPSNFTMLDLEILHYWTTTSVNSFIDFPSCITLFRDVVPALAFSFPFLMEEILALSALHLTKTRPHTAAIYQHASDTHLANALSLFQPEISSLSASNCEACFVFSTIIFCHAWAAQNPQRPTSLFFAPSTGVDSDDIVHVQWVKLHRGSVKVLGNLFPGIREGLLEPLFSPWKGLDRNRAAPLLPVEQEMLDGLETAWTNASFPLKPEQQDTLSATLQSTRRIFSLLTYNPEISQLSAVMSWFSVMKDEFIEMLEQKLPEALLIVVYYCVALKRAERMWWVKDKGENLLKTCLGELGPGWERWTHWPIEQVLGREMLGERDLFGRGQIPQERPMLNERHMLGDREANVNHHDGEYGMGS